MNYFPTTKGILRKLGGDKMPGKVLTWNGDTANEVDFGEGLYGVKIGEYMDLRNVESISVLILGGEERQTTDFDVEVYDEGSFSTGRLMLGDIQLLLAISETVEGIEAGTYASSAPDIAMFRKATFADTIVPIDPKYLPAGGGSGGLPVVELETVISGDSAETVLSAVDSAKMDALNGEACILKFSFSLMGNVANIRAVVGSFGVGSIFAYEVSVGVLGNLTFANETDDGTWMCARGQ